MLRIILNWLKTKGKELLAEDQASYRPDRSTVEQTFNSRDLFHNFIDFKKACDSVWDAGLWRVIKSFNMHEGLV